MPTIATRVPDHVAEDIDFLVKQQHTDRSTVVRDLLAEAIQNRLLMLALERYRKREISISRAAELAKIPVADFLDQATQHHIPIPYGPEELASDLRRADADR